MIHVNCAWTNLAVQAQSMCILSLVQKDFDGRLAAISARGADILVAEQAHQIPLRVGKDRKCTHIGDLSPGFHCSGT